MRPFFYRKAYMFRRVCSALLLVLIAVTLPAFAARPLTITIGNFQYPTPVTDLSCDEFKSIAKDNVRFVGILIDSCNVSDADMESQYKQGGDGSINVRSTGGDSSSVSWTSSGDCVAGRPAGTFTIAKEYLNVATDVVVESLQDPSTAQFDYAGCRLRAVSVHGCFAGTSSADHIALNSCPVDFQETGDNGGGGDGPADPPAYTPGGNGTGTGGTGTGGTGTGGTGTGGTGTGGTGTGGTGTGGTGTGGTGTGGTGTGGTGTGGTGTGGTGTGGTGGSGDGSTQANCGAPGQSKCAIDETGTPTGPGSMFDPLLNLLGIGSDRQGGLNDAVSDDGKDTTLGFFPNLPTASCVNPTISLPGFTGDLAIDICSYTGIVADMFSFLWVFFFGFTIMKLVSRATSKPVA